MTIQEFLALPDLEKDALVAEKVMGWVRLVDCNPTPPENLLYREHIWIRPDGQMACPSIGSYFPPYSTDIAAAWEVVEHLSRTSYRRFTLWQAPAYYVARFKHYDYWHEGASLSDPLSVQAATAPLAIVLAALMTVGAVQK